MADIEVPRRHRARETTRDERIEIRALRDYGLTYEAIMQQTGKTSRQIQHACVLRTPQKTKPHRKAIRTPQKQQLEEWLLQQRFHRFIPWSDLHYYLPPGLSHYRITAISTALHSMGYHRHIRPRKIILTEANKQARLQWAQLQLALRPRPEDWERVIFSDETWAKNDPMWKQWVTRHDFEDPNEWALLRRHPKGWMFWGQFAGRHKGLGFFWEKEWGGITAQKYITFILPLIAWFQQQLEIQHGEGFVFQQDNAPSHRALATRAAMALIGIVLLANWPPNSPDLNPIEHVWFWMKDWIERHFDIQSLSLNELRQAVVLAWEAVPEEYLLMLAHSMPARLQLVLENNGDRTGN